MKVGVETFGDHALLRPRIFDRKAGLHAAEEIALHPVGAGTEHDLLAVGVETVDARVLQHAADDRAHSNVVRNSGHTGAQATHAANDQVDLHARLGRAVERLDHLGLRQ